MTSDDAKRLNPDKQIDAYLKLADRAWDRMKSRRDVEFRVAIGIWTALGASAGFIISAREWVPEWPEIVVGLAIAMLVPTFFYEIWLRGYLTSTVKRDLMVSYFWEHKVHEILETELPAHLRPGFHEEALGLQRATGRGKSAEINEVVKFWNEFLPGLHPSQLVQLLTTCLFALLFWGSILSKAFHTTSSADSSRTFDQHQSDVRGQSSGDDNVD